MVVEQQLRTCSRTSASFALEEGFQLSWSVPSLSSAPAAAAALTAVQTHAYNISTARILVV